VSRDGYPEDWEGIAALIKAEAGSRCENCQAPASGPPHILTVHHLDRDKGNCQPYNLVALCQRCHLVYERVPLLLQLWLWGPPAWVRWRQDVYRLSLAGASRRRLGLEGLEAGGDGLLE